MKYISGLIILLFLFYPGIALSEVLSERIMISSSPNPVGSGARAIGMGGAFIAITDDATAASWNPAGLIQLEKPEISCVGTFFQREEHSSYTAFPDSSKELEVNGIKLNYFSFAYPFQFLKRNTTVSLNYQHMFDFDKKSRLEFTETYTNYSTINSYQYNQKGDLYTLSPACAIELTPYLSLGFTLNLWGDYIKSNSWRVDYSEEILVQRSLNSSLSKSIHTDVYTFEGINYHFGFLWDINNMITLGGVIKSEFEADLKHKYSFSFAKDDKNTSILSVFNEKMNMPMSFGFGLAVRFNDTFSMGFDIYRTLWDDYCIITSNNNKISPVSGKDLHETKIKPTTQVRVGMEYLFIGKKRIIPVRAGLFYDPEPSDGNPDDFYGVTLGSGFVFKNFVFDVAYQYRFGKDVREIEIRNSSSTKDLNEHSLFFSLILYL